ncbi:MAG: ABC transporter permease, partial [Clostridiales bacterium]|nr:ABC transporter permease [Clostridiales bacterium]
WGLVLPVVLLIAISSSLMELLIALSAEQVFEAQSFSYFFRFPMLFLCGLFIPIAKLPVFLRPLSYCLPLTYGTDILRGAITGTYSLSIVLSFAMLIAFAAALFLICRHKINQNWIL